MRLRKDVPRLSTPSDPLFGICKGKDKEFNILGLGESAMAGVGIPKNSLTLTGLTAFRLKELQGCNVKREILAENGLTLKKLNKLIKGKLDKNVDIVIVSIG